MNMLSAENNTYPGECAEQMFAPCYITTDEDGFFEFGPVLPGEYIFELDMDNDGFNELELIHEFEADMDSEVTFPSAVPNVYDLTFTLTQIIDGSESTVEGKTIILSSGDSNNPPVQAIFDNESGNYLVELPEGEWILSHTLSDSEQLEQVDIDSDVTKSLISSENL